MNLGKLTGISSDEYHGADCISHSKLETFRSRPALYKRTFIDRTILRETSPAMALGSALHCSVLEPEHFTARYAHRPEGIDRRTKEGKAQWSDFVALNAGKTIIDADQALACKAMTASIAAHPEAMQLLAAGEAEVSWRASLSALPIPAQCRTDWFNAAGCELSGGAPYVADVKTCDSLSDGFRGFERSAISYGYHRQAGFYMPLLQDAGVDCWSFFFIAVESSEPFGCEVFRLSSDALQAGINETASDLAQLARCYKSGEWPSARAGVQTLALPSYYDR